MNVKNTAPRTISFCINLKYTLVHMLKLLKEAHKKETLDEVTIKNRRNSIHEVVKLSD